KYSFVSYCMVDTESTSFGFKDRNNSGSGLCGSPTLGNPLYLSGSSLLVSGTPIKSNSNTSVISVLATVVVINPLLSESLFSLTFPSVEVLFEVQPATMKTSSNTIITRSNNLILFKDDPPPFK